MSSRGSSRLSRWRRRLLGILRRVNSVSSPVAGIGWTPPPDEREELRRLTVFLEDRRALFDPYNVEATVLVKHSVQQIRAELTKTLQVISDDSRAGDPLRTMRSACQRYLTRADAFDDGPHWHRPPRFHGHGLNDEDDDFILALGELRGVFGTCLGQISSSYDIEVRGDLAGLLPGDDESTPDR